MPRSKQLEPRREQYLERPLPSNEDAERVLLGSVLLDNRLAVGIFAELEPEDFYSPLHRRVAGAMLILLRHAKPIDPILIGEELSREGDIASIGGITTISNMTFGLPHFTNVAEYIRIVRNLALSRKLITLNNQTTTALLAQDEEPDVILARLHSTIVAHQATHSRIGTQSIQTVTADVIDTFEQWEQGNTAASSLHTGIVGLDRRLKYRGLALGELALIAARPSTGKTALLIQIALHIVRLGIPTLFVSLEMLKSKIVMRMLPAITGIANKSINPDTLQKLPKEAARLKEALHSLENLPMYFDRTNDIYKLIAILEYYVQVKGVKLLVFDYLTLFKALQVSKNGTRDTEVGTIVTEIKECLIRNNIAGLGAAQFSREADRSYGIPQMNWLRESGVIEQAADVLLFPYDPRGKLHHEQPELIANKMRLNLFCAKQRDGERNWQVPLDYDKDLQTFEEGEEELEPVKSTTPMPPARNFYEREDDDDE